MESRGGVRHAARSTAPRIWYSVAIVTTMVVLGLVLACGGDSPSSDSGTANAPQTMTDLQAQAQQVLAERLSVSVNDLALVGDEAVEWADSSLGCPEAGMVYAQVITPGHRITFSHSGNEYEVHTSGGGDSGSPVMMVSCEGGTSY